MFTLSQLHRIPFDLVPCFPIQHFYEALPHLQVAQLLTLLAFWRQVTLCSSRMIWSSVTRLSTYWRRMVRPSLQLLQTACPRRGYNLQWHWPSERKIVKRKTISVLNLDTGFRAASRWAWTKVEDVIRVPVVVLKLRDRHSNLRLKRRCIFVVRKLPTTHLLANTTLQLLDLCNKPVIFTPDVARFLF